MFKKILMVGALFTSVSALAQVEIPQSSGYARLLAGVAKPKDIDARFGFGGELGLMFPSNFGVDALFLGSASGSNKLFHYGLGGDYYFAGTGLRAGALIGFATARTDVANVGVSKTKFMVGPRVGFDYTVAAPISIGVELSMPFTFGDNSGYTFYGLADVRYSF